MQNTDVTKNSFSDDFQKKISDLSYRNEHSYQQLMVTLTELIITNNINTQFHFLFLFDGLENDCFMPPPFEV